MATQNDDNEHQDPEPEGEASPPAELVEATGADVAAGADVAHAPAQLGVTRYVHAAFLAGGLLAAYIAGRSLTALWTRLAEWPALARAMPLLLRYSESERADLGMVGGALVGVVAVLWTYRNETIRGFADEVASELSKVTWPNKEAVTNGTIVVIVASVVAAIYTALLDRLWAFVTALIYDV